MQLGFAFHYGLELLSNKMMTSHGLLTPSTPVFPFYSSDAFMVQLNIYHQTHKMSLPIICERKCTVSQAEKKHEETIFKAKDCSASEICKEFKFCVCFILEFLLLSCKKLMGYCGHPTRQLVWKPKFVNGITRV